MANGFTKRRLLAVLVLVAASATAASGEAGGPDYWRVKGVATDDVLAVREQPSADAATVGEIPPTGHDIKNLGCQSAPTFTEWAKMSEAERQAAAQQRWCKVRYGAVEGWVNGRFLTEDASTTTGGQ